MCFEDAFDLKFRYIILPVINSDNSNFKWGGGYGKCLDVLTLLSPRREERDGDSEREREYILRRRQKTFLGLEVPRQ
jgi:hypothetical protein